MVVIAHWQNYSECPSSRALQVLYAPTVTSLTVERVVCDGLRTLSGSTMGAAAVADLMPGSQLSKGFSGLWSRMGIALILSPLIASRLSARMSYKAAILFALFQVGMLLSLSPCTLAPLSV
jgi:hypothetical protein